ncbi:MAG: stalk domain-containing protein [Armatimonadota bacterium]
MRICLTLSLLIMVLGLAVAQDVAVKVTVDGKAQSYSPAARMRGGTVYVPLREGGKSLGVDVKWHGDTQRAQVCTATGCAFIKKADGIVVDGSLLLPLRKMATVTGAKVAWDGAKKTVSIQR